MVAATMLLASGDARADDRGTLVFVRASPETVLEVNQGYGKWKHVCHAPCGQRLDRDRSYRLRGGTIHRPERVALGVEDEVTITIEEGPAPTHESSKSVAIAGWVAVGVSAVLVGVGVATAKGGCIGPCKDDTPSLVLVGVGGLGVVVGTVIGIAGSAVWAATASTVQTVVVQPKQPAVTPILSFAW